MKLTNLEVENLQQRLNDIIECIDVNREIIEQYNIDIAITFIQPIMDVATNISNQIFLQTKDNLNDVEL